MGTVPRHPKIYHITHVDNLRAIIACGGLWSDAERVRRALDSKIVGITNIKQDRLIKPVPCRPGTTVGQYVPFYLCPRSVMLYILHMRNHPELAYKGGQRPIVHLEADMPAVVSWADQNGRKWAFTDANARAGYAGFYSNLVDLDKVDWSAVAATDWRDPAAKEGKQAEFLVHQSFPWSLVRRIGVCHAEIKARVEAALKRTEHRPVVAVEQAWYY